jgi:hypothetical protein
MIMIFSAVMPSYDNLAAPGYFDQMLSSLHMKPMPSFPYKKDTRRRFLPIPFTAR